MANKIPAIVTVRTKSTRLPEKCLLDFGNKSVIEHIIDRCIATNLDPIICTTKETSDDKLIDIAIAKKVIEVKVVEIKKIVEARLFTTKRPPRRPTAGTGGFLFFFWRGGHRLNMGSGDARLQWASCRGLSANRVHS